MKDQELLEQLQELILTVTAEIQEAVKTVDTEKDSFALFQAVSVNFMNIHLHLEELRKRKNEQS